MSKNKMNLDELISRTKVYLIIIAIILIVLSIREPKAIIPSIVFYALVLLYSVWSSKKRKAEITKHIDELTLNVDKAAQSTIINSPFPLVVVETSGNIIWKSSNFIKTFANIDIGTYLSDIIKELKQKIDKDNNDKAPAIYESMKIGEKTYKIIAESVKSKEKGAKSEYLSTIYFLDETNYVNLLNDFSNSRTCIGIVVIDNYEELMQRATEEEKLKITSEAEKSIYAWVNKYNGLSIKSERDTYVCIFDQYHVEEIKDEKFDILDEIKEIKTEDNIQTTLSIAISEEGESNVAKYKSAKAVIDIALGRGGDQAIIKQNGKYYFFGGRTQEVEKRTRVKARIVSQALEELVNSSSNVLIMGHTNSDIDAMGSAMGVYRFVKAIGKDAYIVNETTGTSLDTFIQDLKDIEDYQGVLVDKNTALSKISSDSLLIVVDTDKKNYVEVPELLTKTDKIAVIDHHRRGTDYIENAMLTFHEVYASSACELVTEIVEFSERAIHLTTFEVEALYAGIIWSSKDSTYMSWPGKAMESIIFFLFFCFGDIFTYCNF